MSQEQPRIERSETSLLEHTDSLVNLLNNFVSKETISSQHVLRRLEYLYNRLSDFLDGSEDWVPPESKPPIESEAWLPKEEDNPTKKITDLMFECSLCKSHVKIYKFDAELSMSIHCQEKVHERAIQMQKIRELKDSAVARPILQVKEEDQNLKYISYTGGTNHKFHCWLCDVVLNGDESIQQHVSGTAHQKKLATRKHGGKQTACNSKEQYWCDVCDLSVGSGIDALEHQRGEAHNLKLLSILKEPDKFWLKIPEVFRCHQQYFSNLGQNMLRCNVCIDNIPKTQINVLSHIRGKKHTGALWATTFEL